MHVAQREHAVPAAEVEVRLARVIPHAGTSRAHFHLCAGDLHEPRERRVDELFVGGVHGVEERQLLFLNGIRHDAATFWTDAAFALYVTGFKDGCSGRPLVYSLRTWCTLFGQPLERRLPTDCGVETPGVVVVDVLVDGIGSRLERSVCT